MTAGAVLQRKVGAVQAVRGVDLVLRQGETLGVVGESGCGKSTLGRMIVGLERPTAGQVLFEGTGPDQAKGAELRRRHRDLQLMFQDPYSSLDPRMRVGTIIREPLVVQGIGSPAEQRERVQRAPSRGRARRPTPSSGTRTNSPEASASASGWPGRWRLTPG